MVVRWPPCKLSRTTRKSSSATCVNMQAAGAIAEGPDVWRAGFEALVHSDVTARIELDSGDIEADGLRVGDAASGDENIGAGDDALAVRGIHVNVDLLAGKSFDVINAGAEQHFDAFVAEKFQERGANVGIFPADELRASLDQRHFRAEAAHVLREFQADVAAAQNDKMPGTRSRSSASMCVIGFAAAMPG